MENIEKILKIIEKELSKINNLEELKILKSKYIYKSIYLNELKEKIKNSSKEKIASLGKEINFYIKSANELFATREKKIIKSFSLNKNKDILISKKNMEIELPIKKGFIHPLTQITFKVQKYFDKLNFYYSHSFEVENEKFNFTFLNIPKDHPARAMQDTLYLSEKDMLLRTHSTNMTSRRLFNYDKTPISGYSIGSVFRNDDNDATHSYQFNQIDFFAVDKFSIANLKFVINNLLKAVFEKDIKTRYRVSFFPFTEPSYEVDINCPNCNGDGCNICKHTGWIEILGSGMLHPNVLKNSSIDINENFGIAAGIGLERLAMIKWNITDIRDFFNNDLIFLKRFN
ncbi:MAG: phenylalanine--tRNA ligase alpha subunit [Candidatus Hepatoplasma vulgare]|nr:MAG: phenylalanine--tRNA ligase alpha subunit [Candidatus Hepatoplasma sp.]